MMKVACVTRMKYTDLKRLRSWAEELIRLHVLAHHLHVCMLLSGTIYFVKNLREILYIYIYNIQSGNGTTEYYCSG